MDSISQNTLLMSLSNGNVDDYLIGRFMIRAYNKDAKKKNNTEEYI